MKLNTINSIKHCSKCGQELRDIICYLNDNPTCPQCYNKVMENITCEECGCISEKLYVFEDKKLCEECYPYLIKD